MSKINDGGPAFPFITWRSPDGMIAHEVADGMSLRDWYAGQFLAGAIGNPVMLREQQVLLGGDIDEGRRELASAAYKMADAMLAAREQSS